MTSVRSMVRARTLQHRLPRMAIVGLLGMIALVYWPGLGGGYAFDDFPNIVFNKNLHVTSLDWPAWVAASFSSPASDLQRPLAMLSLAINHYFTGLDPVPMKATNLAIHLVNTLLVLALVTSLVRMVPAAAGTDGRRGWAARFTTAAWALHPINLIPVLFVVQRMESLSHTFVFAGLWFYLRGRQRQLDGGNGWWLVGGGLLLGTAIGVLAKESAALLPLYAFCIELCILHFRADSRGTDKKLHALYAAVLFLPVVLGMAWLLPRVTSPGAYAFRDFTLGERLLTEARVVMDYLRWTLFPSLRELGLYHDDYPVSHGLWQPPSTLFALLGLGILLAGAAWLRRWRPLTSLGILWFLGAQLLTATVIPLELVHEHRNYFASLGICLVLADVLLLSPRSPGRHRLGALVAALALLAFSLTTHLRAREWADPLRFAITEAAKHPQSPRATYTLGQTLVVTSRYQPDSPLLDQGRTALERARAVPRSGILPHSSLLLLAANTGAPMENEWWLEMQQRLRAKPLGTQEITAIGSLERCAREGTCNFPREQMIATFDAALTHGANAELLSIYGDYALHVLHNRQIGLGLWLGAVQQQPGVAQYRVNLIKLLIALGQYQQASTEINSLRRLGKLGQNVAVANELQLRLDSTASNSAR